MAIYRGPGGSGDAVNDSSSETRLAVEARDAAIAAQAAAEAAQVAAELAETNAETAETNAETAETNAETAATNAASSASAASTSASNASSSASSASTSATNAASSASSASSSASAASTSATNAATSATNAANSATAAATSATNASNSATAAASSASSASSSASTATTQASNASTSATNAASSATSASSSASTATTQAGLASTSATNAANSASAASTSATNASNSASAASTSASNAATSATNAASSATAASSAQSAAEAARDATLAAYDSFDDRYLGAKISDPTLDNDGNALVAGALYFNSTDGVMKLWTGTIWTAAYVSGAGVLLQANNLSDLNNVSSARTNLGVTATGADTTYAYRANNLSDLASASTARTNLGLGTAATTAATDYATAAQGAKADTALQPAAIGVSVQGYDADLDAIAALSGTSGLLKKTAANTWSLDTTAYLSGTVGVANGGTGLTSLTAGYIPFGNGTSAFGSSSSLFWDNTNKRLGVGTTSPQGQLVASNSGAEGLEIDSTAVAGTSRLLAYNRTTSAEIPLQLRGSIQTFLTAATERMRIDSSGNVGIGTSSPAQKFEVYNAATNSQCYGVFQNNRARNAAVLTKTTNGGFYTGTSVGTDTLCWQVYDESAGERMRIDSSGNLGLGVTPSAWFSGTKALQIGAASNIWASTSASNSAFSTNEYLDSSAASRYIISSFATRYQQFNGSHQWYTAPSGTAGNAITFTQAMTLDASGNLGIGTSSPSQKLDVVGTSRYTFNVANAYTLQTSINAAGSAFADDYKNALSHIWQTSGSERMRIDSSGNVGIGTSSPNANLHVQGTVTSDGSIAFNQQLTGTTAYNSSPQSGTMVSLKYNAGGSYAGMGGWSIAKENATDGNYASYFAIHTRANGGSIAEKARVSAAGGFSVGTTADPGAGAIYATGNITAYYSDERLKTKIGNIDNALDKVKQIETMVYHANDTAVELGYDASVIEVGVTAQSVQKVQPEVVVPAPVDQQYLTVRYDRLVPLLIEAIKELEEKVAKLETK